MAESRLINAYLTELRYSVAKLPDAEDIVDEAADHLLSCVDALLARGASAADAEAQALARFGSAPLVAKVFVEEAKRGGAVSTTRTRRAGLAAMAAFVMIIAGQSGNDPAGRGAVHGVFLGLLTAGLGAFVIGLWGIRRRHGGLGIPGRVAFWWFLLSPVFAVPFGWGAGFAIVVQWLAIMFLLGIAMIRARVLPVRAVAMFTLSPLFALVVFAVMIRADRDTGPWFYALLSPAALGYALIGRAMWHEPALDDRRDRRDPGPLTTV